ncbi:EAL domain-containing protein, partial [Ancylomarina sp. 16SWW S1-10-2]|uniref:EAL domain-containing protein n=1 Tax=Ancylomarina sp. 16SWW S1-10-2 TaxID=2499681 RepID=UPI0012AD953D
SFIKNLIHSRFDQVMVNNINELAKNLQMETVAEFVENQETANKLTEMGIHYAQGYHFHQPSELAEFNSHRLTNHLVKHCEKYNVRRVD